MAKRLTAANLPNNSQDFVSKLHQEFEHLMEIWCSHGYADAGIPIGQYSPLRHCALYLFGKRQDSPTEPLRHIDVATHILTMLANHWRTKSTAAGPLYAQILASYNPPRHRPIRSARGILPDSAKNIAILTSMLNKESMQSEQSAEKDELFRQAQIVLDMWEVVNAATDHPALRSEILGKRPRGKKSCAEPKPTRPKKKACAEPEPARLDLIKTITECQKKCAELACTIKEQDPWTFSETKTTATEIKKAQSCMLGQPNVQTMMDCISEHLAFVERYRIGATNFYNASLFFKQVSASSAFRDKYVKHLSKFLIHSTMLRDVPTSGRAYQACEGAFNFLCVVQSIASTRCKGAKYLVGFTRLLAYLATDPHGFRQALQNLEH